MERRSLLMSPHKVFVDSPYRDRASDVVSFGFESEQEIMQRPGQLGALALIERADEVHFGGGVQRHRPVDQFEARLREADE